MTLINRNAKQLHAPIVSNKRVGQYHQIIINIGEVAATCKPGNFVAISVGGDSSRMVLRRAFAISRVSTSSTVGGTMELIVAPHGQGSKWLCQQGEGVVLDLVAPLGTAFGIPTEPVSVLLVGGGYGSAPLFGLAELLNARGCRSVNSMRIYTEDGSMGSSGRVTDPIPEIVRDLNVAVIYSCGPMPMLAAITKISNELDVVHQCAVEESMACGIGICMTCVLPVENEDGAISNLRSCIDGPVMDGSKVQWDRVGEQL
jgi:dihydroorotate dehydrogenase electron transfer subunit